MSSSPPRAWLPTAILDALRGFLIGLAELIPGVSGGTIALITGVYERLIASASHVIGALRALIRPPTSEDAAQRQGRLPAARAELAQVQWSLVLPLVGGMVIAVFTVAGVAERLVTSYPEQARGLFFGLVAASLLVPLRLLPPRRLRGFAGIARDGIMVLGAAALAAWLVGLAAQTTSAEPPTALVFFAAAIAICALVVPGVSGSFFLLAIGIYSATLTAVSERDLAYIGTFAAGALLGLVSVVQLLRYLLERHRRVTLLVMTGLMAGSLRALWPWQMSETEDKGTGTLLAPQEPLAEPILFALLGAALVLAMIVLDARHGIRETGTSATADTSTSTSNPSARTTRGHAPESETH
ncbi:DUF368 domain-containing protein [Bogoriella caseilytica]|uniref:DUF368 domain-containing protein n=1 Tax=Bogoriella caseilytica TaxID=56055 RepID=UPI001FE9CF6A|nr:DUF368 domain-containing protein [Bogoriella caseilytica]